MIIRPLKEEDISFALSLTHGEGWDNVRRDFEELVGCYPEGCFLGVKDDHRVGIVTALDYGNVGFVGNLIVSEEFRGSGFGSQLLFHAIDFLHDYHIDCIFLDGVPNAVSFYERQGFRKLAKSLRFEGIIEGNQSDYVRKIESEDISSIQAIDRQLFGCDRGLLIESWSKRNPNLCFLLEVDNEISGFIMGSVRAGFVRVGPWVMQGHHNKSHELLEVLAAVTGDSLLRIGVLETNSQAVKIITEHRLTQYTFSWRMILGQPPSSEPNDGVYAIASPARG